MSRASALRVEKVSVRSPCFTIGAPSSDNCNWLIVCSYCPPDDNDRKGSAPLARHPASPVRILNTSSFILRALHGLSTSSFKSIEGCAGKVSVHQMACHFILLHFWGIDTSSTSTQCVSGRNKIN